MAVAGCPHCRVNLRINPEFAGQTMRCPNCRGTFTVPNIDTAMVIDAALVEIRAVKAAQSPPRTVSHISQPGATHERPSIRGQLGGRPLAANLPRDNVYFFGPGSKLDLGRGVLKQPLVYATGAPRRGTFDASLIDCTLTVASPDAAVEERLPYWPNYYDCSPAQRARYLDWLLSGKRDPSVELGYVFIYFYGLERRVLVDRTDFLAIGQELIRLLPIYDRSNSFRRYAGKLLWLTLYLASQSATVPQTLLNEAMAVTGRWDDDLLGMCLAILYCQKQPLSAPVALLASQNNSLASSSVIIRRHRDELTKLFETRYQSRFGDGIQLHAREELKRINYHPASGTLLRSWGAVDGLSLPALPNILGDTLQFRQIVECWDESIQELKAYSRASRSSGGKLTADAYEALPTELQEGDHPELDAWMKAWEDNVDEKEWPIVPISALAAIKSIPARERLTKSQCQSLLRTADAIGLGVEPDARMTGKSYRWDERVALFFLDKQEKQDVTNYAAASLLLRLGASISEADGHVKAEELTFIADHLEVQFKLSDADSKRLERLQYLLLHSRFGDNAISPLLVKHLPREQRLLVGEFLVGVAAVDQVITKDEMRVLRKTYKLLDLDVADLDKLIAPHVAPDKAPAGTTPQETKFRLDMQAISRIKAETRQVADVLLDAMADDGASEGSSRNSSPSAVVVRHSPHVLTASTPTSTVQNHADDTALDSRFRPFLTAVLEQEEWTPAELRELADKWKVMLSGAVETINEWSTNRYGDWLIEEGDTYHVRQDLIEETD